MAKHQAPIHKNLIGTVGAAWALCRSLRLRRPQSSALSVGLALVALMVLGCQNDFDRLPGWDGDGNYNVEPYVRVAISFQALGRDKACAKLLRYANESKHPCDVRLIVLCRMLFTPYPKREFRQSWI